MFLRHLSMFEINQIVFVACDVSELFSEYKIYFCTETSCFVMEEFGSQSPPTPIVVEVEMIATLLKIQHPQNKVIQNGIK